MNWKVLETILFHILSDQKHLPVIRVFLATTRRLWWMIPFSKTAEKQAEGASYVRHASPIAIGKANQRIVCKFEEVGKVW